MHFGLKGKEVLAITLLTFVVVGTTTLAHLSQLSRVVVQEALAKADLIVKQIYAQSNTALSRARSGDPWDDLKTDRDVRTLLDASVGYSAHLVYALIADRNGRAIVHTDRQKEGVAARERSHVEQLLSLNPLRRFHDIYWGDSVYEVTLPLNLKNEPFGTIRLGIATSLLQRELKASLRNSLFLGGLALPVAWLIAIGLANLTLRPIRRLTREVDRLRRGEFDISGDLPRGDALGDLASQIQLLGQQLQSDRLRILSDKVHVRQAVDYLEDGIIFLGQDRRILFFNKAAETIVGSPLEDVAGQSLDRVLEPSHPLRGFLEEAFEHRIGPRNVPLVLSREGRPRELRMSVFFVPDPQNATGTVVLLRDLESVKGLQSVLSYSAKLTALANLTSGLAHEVKNPLNTMRLHLELLKEKQDVPAEEIHERVDALGRQIQRLDRVVGGFLKFMRPEELSLKQLDLNGLLKNIATLLEAEWQKQGTGFMFQLDPTLSAIMADEGLLHQAFFNIMLNACQAMPTGGKITIVTELEQPGVVKVSITDAGIGISAKEKEEIFKLYYTTKPDGNGIGLSLVYRIVQLHDGLIDIVSEVGCGTTIIVRFPQGPSHEQQEVGILR